MTDSRACSDTALHDFAERLKVCGHPVRLKLLCLIEKEDACVTELWRCLNQSQPVISQHLAVLKEKGIVEAQIQGNKRIYSIADPFVQSIVRSLEVFGESSLLTPVSPAG
jgi:DNA-binding transcriptional ArsR family regulator